ncbi:MAG: transcription-repair coupling factor, partial [Gammaproteobacteria bacterium]|nr:transcription-repair coupling factor [Gammaproteobacteria bacterium]
MPATPPPSPLPTLPVHTQAAFSSRWGSLYGSGAGLALSQAALNHNGFLLVVTADMQGTNRLLEELQFYLDPKRGLPLLPFPDWETLPYDRFSPHQDIISDRLRSLYHLPLTQRGVLVVPAATLMQRLPPRSYIEASSLVVEVGDSLPLEAMRLRLEAHGYSCVQQVMEHGEFSVRGSLLDLFPSGSRVPFRIELFDDEVETIRAFDPDTQRSGDKIDEINLLPAREFPLDSEAIRQFRQRFREQFEGDPQRNVIYRDLSNGLTPPGVEQYLPLFFDALQTLFDYLPPETLLFTGEGVDGAIEKFATEYQERYGLAKYESERPPLPPQRLFLAKDELYAKFKTLPRHHFSSFESDGQNRHNYNLAAATPPSLTLDGRAKTPSARLEQFLAQFKGRTLFVAESPGRLEVVQQLLNGIDIRPTRVSNWQEFTTLPQPLGITIAPLEAGLLLQEPPLAVITESQLFGNQVLQRRRRSRRKRDSDAVVRNLAELQIGHAVVHEDHGVGRFLGLQRLSAGGCEAEFLTLEYAGGDKLYVPVTSLDLISRYTGVVPDKAPLHRLGSGQWEKAKRKAKEKIRDIAAELLEIYAKREAQVGLAYPLDEGAYQQFSAAFPFEETPDQEDAIHAVVADMQNPRPMDRLICGDVGFGKT